MNSPATPTLARWYEPLIRLREACAPLRGPRALTLVVDQALADTAFTTAAAGLLQRDLQVEVRRLPVDPAHAAARDLHDWASALADADVVVVLGGGTVTDLVKLATLVVDDSRAARALAVPDRSGLVVLPHGTARRRPLMAVPTTLGTGAEVSQVAVEIGPRRRRLISGPAVRATVAVHDPAATRDLPTRLVAAGVLEVLSRAAGPYVAGRPNPLADALVEGIVPRLLRLGDQVADHLVAGTAVPDPVRAEIADLSDLTHRRFVRRVDEPFAVKGWLLAHELAAVAGVDKMTATTALWPALWSAVDEGVATLGSRSRLRELYQLIRAHARTPLDPAPGPGLNDLLAAWGQGPVRLPLTAREVTAVVTAVQRGWGAGLPMLGDLDAATVRRIVRGAVTPDFPTSCAALGVDPLVSERR